MKEELLSILQTRTEDARLKASTTVADWRRTAEVANSTLRAVCTDDRLGSSESESISTLPAEMASGIHDREHRLTHADYLEALEINAEAMRQRRSIIEYVRKTATGTISRQEKRAAEIRRQIEQASANQKQQVQAAKNRVSSERHSSEGTTRDRSNDGCILIPVGIGSYMLMNCAFWTWFSLGLLPIDHKEAPWGAGAFLLLMVLVPVAGIFIGVKCARVFLDCRFSTKEHLRIAGVERESTEQIRRVNLATKQQLGALEPQLARSENRVSLSKRALAVFDQSVQ